MNSLFRSAARCLRSGPAVYLPRQTDGRSQWASVRLLCSAADLQKDLGEMVKKDKVVVFMKGTPAQPMCGFSNAVVQILRMHGVDNYAAYNVLEDQDLRQGVKDFSNWPTIPQVYFNGEFVGGCDIFLQMHQNGDLVEELKKLGIRSAVLDAEKESK
ncbi:glutaredoxin-related protein 5, mitochondrial [Maylandia zebra]|uniref:Glutaredoxin-related protein 5, mitochondrial n=4 Tax=Haplochromini TaxID=319058 RepID=A0A3B4H3I2_9CICH|nr:glutaredoxin-related protein 5, mitochondrial [Maylandia zebra]XP_005724892.1 PREDICTED: glutaredoxin-related protein 5, mitochondrial [Pundamilia nyererei]XP_005917165.1 glutaredoxin-related protein 5, mitochondrial [Haplochromis burtoni]XP_026049781.1 glutaredoxin-related protein 5, mitochondrial-like [Astatotilapia calliptera]XP_026049909.1 glutaredoxin-related protein 5, mitochondrial-like [Astatotilapia calliptera]